MSHVSQIKVRMFSLTDFEAVVTLMTELQDYFVEIDSSDEKIRFSNSKAAAEYVNQAILDVEKMNGAILVAVQENRIVGFVQGVVVQHTNDVFHRLTHRERSEGWIGLLFTKIDVRGQGVGELLLNSLKSFFLEQGCSLMKLRVASENELALSFYKKQGFKPGDIEMSIRL